MTGTAASICGRCRGSSEAWIELHGSPVCAACYDRATTSVERDPLLRLIARLEELGCHGRGATWQCPSHADHDPSLSIARARNGGVVLNCHAGCSTTAVLEALGWSWADLFSVESRMNFEGPRPDVSLLEHRHRAGQLRPERVVLGPLPNKPLGVSVEDMRRIAEDMRLLFGLHRAVGERRPMPYSSRFAARRMGWPSGHMRANKVIRALVQAQTIDRVGELQPRDGQPRGTALYAPPLGVIAPDGAAEVETIPVEATERQPPLEVVDEMAVQEAQPVGRKHVTMVATGDTTATRNGPMARGARTSLDVVHDRNDSSAYGISTRDAWEAEAELFDLL